MNPVTEYLQQFNFKPRFSEPIYAQSVTAGGLKLVDVIYPNSNVLFVYVFGFFLSIQTSAAATLLTLRDRVASRNLYQFNQLVENNGYYHLFVINEGNRISISIETASDVFFNIGYQWVFRDKIKE
jgi:hypothetical protein